MKNKKLLFLMLCAAVFCFILIWAFMPGNSEEAASAEISAPHLMIIDAGHGGMDGGAVSKNGVRESTINLSIAKKLEALANLCGTPCVMTRTDENSIHSSDADTIREQKVSDMKNRVALVNDYDNAILVSIHQNAYGTKAKGAQVFYRKDNALSFALAVLVQEDLRLALCESNARTPAVIPKSAYLFKNTSCPAILVECGFLSNSEESVLLQQDVYQIKAALAVMAGYLAQGSQQKRSKKTPDMNILHNQAQL